VIWLEIQIGEEKMSTIDNTDYSSLQTQPEVELKRLFVLANINPDIRLKLAKAEFVRVTDWCHIARDDAKFEQRVLKLLPELVEKEDDPTEDATRKIKTLSTLSALWDMTKASVEHERKRSEQLMDNPNTAPEIKDTDRSAQRNLYRSKHPDESLTDTNEPHPKFVDMVYRDLAVSSTCIKDYAVGDMRLRGENIETESGVSKSVDKVIMAVETPIGVRCSTEEEVMTRLNAFFITLEFTQVCEFTKKHYTRVYVNKLNEFRKKHPGLGLLIKVDRYFRKAVKELQLESEAPMKFKPP